MDLGFVPGTRIEAVRRSPAGDPTAFGVRGTVIALRGEVARQILVAFEADRDNKEVSRCG